jgi:hypothetical protein
MLVLPVQGMAVIFTPPPLHKVLAEPSSAMPCHSSHAPHATNQTPADDGTTAPDAANHLCCHQIFTYTPMHTLDASAQKFSSVSPFVRPLFTLFIPDSPDRPPRG